MCVVNSNQLISSTVKQTSSKSDGQDSLTPDSAVNMVHMALEMGTEVPRSHIPRKMGPGDPNLGGPHFPMTSVSLEFSVQFTERVL